jgi:hypothetical protein
VIGKSPSKAEPNSQKAAGIGTTVVSPLAVTVPFWPKVMKGEFACPEKKKK